MPPAGAYPAQRFYGGNTVASIDFEYSKHGLFTSVYPVSDAAIRQYARINIGDGTGKLLPHEFVAFKMQAMQAGYSIRKARIIPVDDNALLAELGVL